MQNEPLRVAFYGLAASELDLFTIARRAKNASLVLVVDQGAMAIARRIAEIAGVKTSADPWDLPKSKPDWIVAGRLARTPAAPLERAIEGGATVLSVSEAEERFRGLKGDAAEGADAASIGTWGAAGIDESGGVGPQDSAEISRVVLQTPLAPASGAGMATLRSAFARPTENVSEPGDVVGWALDGLMSSVRSLWGVALARANGDICLVERGIRLEVEHPDIWRWLRSTVEMGESKGSPPASKDLAWVPLKSEARLLGGVVLGRGGEAGPFSDSDRIWLQKVGERIASILSHKVSSGLVDVRQEEQVAPAAVWAAPVLERAAWARGWLRNQFEASGCWLFAAAEDSSEPQLIDESWGTASPGFLLNTVREAMEKIEPQVWLESGGDRAIVLQPLAPWGVKWTVVLEGVPWRGDGRAMLARLKKSAVTLARLLKST